MPHHRCGGAGGQGDLAAIHLQFAADQLEQRGLAGAIAADQADLVASRNEGGRALEQRAAFDCEIEVCNA